MQGMMWIILGFIALVILIITHQLYKKNLKKSAAVMIVILLVCVGLFFGVEGETRWYNYYYVIDIKPTDLSEYQIDFPVALDSYNFIHEIMDDLEVEGEDAQISLIDSIYGKALRVKGSGEIHVYTEIVGGRTSFFEEPLKYPEGFQLNMFDRSEGGHSYHWINVNFSKRFSLQITMTASLEKGRSIGKIISMPWEEDLEGPVYKLESSVDTEGWHLLAFREDLPVK
jgi:hypothetical protein